MEIEATSLQILFLVLLTAITPDYITQYTTLYLNNEMSIDSSEEK